MPPQRSTSKSVKAGPKKKATKKKPPTKKKAGSTGAETMSTRGAFIGVIVIGVLAAGVWFVLAEDVPEGGTPCGALFVPPERPVLGEGETPVELVSAGDPTPLDFGKSRKVDRRKATLKAEGETRPPAGIELKVVPGEFIRSQGGQIPQEQISAKAVVRDDRSAVDVQLCVDPAEVHPGRYVGSVAIDDPRVSAPSISYTATLQYPRQRWVAALGFGVCFLALGYLWLGVGRGSLIDWLKSGPTIIGVGAGIAFAAVAWNAAYSTVWGTGFGDVIKLVGGVFTAFTTAFLAPRIFEGAKDRTT